MAYEDERKQVRKAVDCLTVAADYKPDTKTGKLGAKMKVMELGHQLKGTGVCIKINSILRVYGTELSEELRGLDLKVGGDYKLIDIPETMERDAILVKDCKFDFLTVMCAASVEGMWRVKQVLKDTETDVLGVTVLTTQDEEECQNIYGCSTKAATLRLARLAKLAGLNGVICSPKELSIFTSRPYEFEGFSPNTPGVRLEGKTVENDDQKRVGTPYDAIKNGAKRIIVGRPIIGVPDPLAAVKEILEEIQRALDAKALGDKKK